LATDGFQEAIDLLESLTLKSEASGLEQRVSEGAIFILTIILIINYTSERLQVK